MSDYKKDPLWLQAQEAVRQYTDEAIGATDLYMFDKDEKVVAAVVLGYFDGRKVNELYEFIQNLSTVADGYKKNAIVAYKYGSTVGRAEIYHREAEECLESLWEEIKAKNASAHCRECTVAYDNEPNDKDGWITAMKKFCRDILCWGIKEWTYAIIAVMIGNVIGSVIVWILKNIFKQFS